MRTEILCFFEKFLNDYKSGKLSNEDERKLSEFYISQKYIESKANLDEKEIKKYTALGWFIYNYNKKF
uniref:Uncharacterized protein n=1 Tax=viral metagenome TaxID=1070528 RepID=A0A6C0KSP4_9ZZZZ